MKNMTNKILKITVQFPFSQIVVKIFEKLIFNKMFTYFRANDLMAPNQSDSLPSESYVSQLLLFIHKIYTSIIDGCDGSGIFFDISKAFHKIWYIGLILILKQSDIFGDLLNVIPEFLSKWKQSFAFKGQTAKFMLEFPKGYPCHVFVFKLY